jgi:DNA-binding NarL/FixJ family response regulator
MMDSLLTAPISRPDKFRKVNTVRILLADDHKIVRQGIKLYLESKGVEIVGEAMNGREAVEMVRNLHPDIVIMDIHMPELTGIEAARRIRHDNDDVRILVLTAYNEPSYVHALLEVGADGFVLKTAEMSELYKALQEVAVGRIAFDPELVRRALQHQQDQSKLRDTLTDREIEVLAQAAHVLTNKEIGQTLFVSDRTIQGHLQNIYQKLHVTTRTEAVTKALNMRLITVNGEETR